MTPLANHLNAEELAVMNEIVRTGLVLTHGRDPDRRALIVTQAAAQIVGGTMAIEAYARRELNSTRLERAARVAFEQSMARTYTHVLAEAASGRDFGDILCGSDEPPRLPNGPMERKFR